MSCANANVPPAFIRDPVLPVLSVKSPFNLYHATKFVESVVNVKPPSGPVDPSLHVQAATDVLALGELELPGHTIHVVAIIAPTVVEYVPAAQSVQTALPVAILYFPATQAVHGPDPSGPVDPALHMQAATDVLALGELELLGHARQVAAAVAAVVVEYVPAAQSVHAAEPVAILYLPATH